MPESKMTALRLAGTFGARRGVGPNLLVSALIVAAASSAALAQPPAPEGVELADNRPTMMLRGGTPPAATSFDAPDEAGQEDRLAAMAAYEGEEAQAGRADQAADTPGRGLNVAAAAQKGASAVGAAFDPALLERAAKLAEASAEAPAPRGGYAEALAKAVATTDAPTRAAYAALRYQSVWFGADGSSDRARAYLDALSIAEKHALPVGRYGGKALSARLDALAPTIAEALPHWPSRPAPKQPAAAPAASAVAEASSPAEGAARAEPIPEPPLHPRLIALAELERDLSLSYLLFASDLSGGFVDPRALSKDMDVKRPVADPTALLLLAREASDIKALAGKLPPQTPDYQRLLIAYAALREAVAKGLDFGPQVISDISIRPLDRGAKIDQLRARLMGLGDLASSAPRATHPETGQTLYDRITEAALRRFQGRHGLSVDGVAGAATRDALNVDLGQRLRQIAVNLERARWSNRPMLGRVVQVNIPDFHVDLLQDAKSIYRSRVVVGKRKHQTPEFSDEMTEVIVNPYWHVPFSIATKEYLPMLQANYKAMSRMGIDIYHRDGRRVNAWWVDWEDYDRKFFPFRMRQRPGRGNALGEVKFIFPNKHAVYLHDTPHKRLFSKARRAFSHGCIRVHQPHKLARTLLAAQSRDPSGLYRNLRAQREELPTPLRKPVPVHILYRTAWAEPGVGLHFREDIYGRDALVAEVMRQAGVAF